MSSNRYPWRAELRQQRRVATTGHRGYSLVELMAVLAILSLATATSLALLGRDDPGQAMREARSVIADIRMARMRVVVQNKLSLVTVRKDYPSGWPHRWVQTWMSDSGAAWNLSANHRVVTTALERGDTFTYTNPSSGTLKFSFDRSGLVTVPSTSAASVADPTNPTHYVTLGSSTAVAPFNGGTPVVFNIISDRARATITMNVAGQITVTRFGR